MSVDQNRRKVLIGATGLAGASVGGFKVAEAAPSPDVPGVSLVVPVVSVESPDIKDSTDSTGSKDEIKTYEALKKRLSEAGAWSKVFDDSFEESTVSFLSTIASEEKLNSTHNARLVEPLLGEISSLLDRCLQYREEGRRIELLGIQAGVNRLLSASLAETNLEIARLDLNPGAAAILATNYPSAAAQFASLKDAIGQGTAAQLNAQALANSAVQTNQSKRLGLSVAKLRFIQEFEAQMQSRHDVPGNADNYSERYEFLRQLYLSDISAAYRRAFAVTKGLKPLFGLEPKLPTPAPVGFLEQMVTWTREAMRSVNLIGETEIEITRRIVVPVADGPMSVDVRPYFDGLNHVRLRWVSASFRSNPDTTDPDFKDARFGGMLVRTDKDIGPSVVVPIGVIRNHLAPLGGELVDGALLYNVDPRSAWTIRLNKTGLNNKGPVDRTTHIQELYIHMHVLAVPDQTKGNDFWINADRV